MSEDFYLCLYCVCGPHHHGMTFIILNMVIILIPYYMTVGKWDVLEFGLHAFHSGSDGRSVCMRVCVSVCVSISGLTEF